jgi:hypothetical protein
MATERLTSVLGIIILFLFGSLIFLCFFQFPSMDDFVGFYFRQRHGWWQGIKTYLINGNGRYIATPAFLSIGASRTLMENYGFVLAFFLLFTLVSLTVFIRIVNKKLFISQLPLKKAFLVAGMLLIVFTTTVPEIPSFFFWMTTSVVYLFPLSIFLFLISSYIILLQSDQKHRWRSFFIVSFLTVFLAGCNEIMMFYSLGFPFLITFMFLVSGKKVPVQILTAIFFNIILALLILQIPGNHARAKDFIPKQSVLFSSIGALYRTGQTLLPVFSNPLFYISCWGVYLLSRYLKPQYVEWFAYKKTNWLAETAMLLGLIFFIHLIIRQLGGEVLPPRAINIVICISCLGFWWIILINRKRLESFSGIMKEYANGVRPVFLFTFIVALLFSKFSGQLIANLVTAPVHARILKNRIFNIEQAKAHHNKKVDILLYDQEVDMALDKLFPSKKRFIREEFPMPPSFSFFYDEPNHKELAYFYAEYYGIDTIVNKEGQFARWGLTSYESW